MEDATQAVGRLLRELELLEDEQRELDLRDDRAVQACERKVDELRTRIEQLRERSGRQ